MARSHYPEGWLPRESEELRSAGFNNDLIEVIIKLLLQNVQRTRGEELISVKDMCFQKTGRAIVKMGGKRRVMWDCSCVRVRAYLRARVCAGACDVCVYESVHEIYLHLANHGKPIHIHEHTQIHPHIHSLLLTLARSHTLTRWRQHCSLMSNSWQS